MEVLYDLFGVTSHQVARTVLAVLIALIILFILLRVVNVLFRRTEQRLLARGRDTGFLRYLRYGVKGALYVVCIAGALQNVPGMDTVLTSILAGSGILAVVVGLASQQALGNVVSGALLLLFRPFKVGDTIRYLAVDITGVVEEIGFRHTAIRTGENKLLLIPNSLMNSNVVENLSVEASGEAQDEE